jgi:hypothetical protein
MSATPDDPPAPSKPIKIAADEPARIILPPPSETVELKQASQATFGSRTGGVNLMNNVMGIDNIQAKLKTMGIDVKKILYFRYGNGSQMVALLYCLTRHGHYVIVEPPSGTTTPGGDLSLLEETRTGFLPTSTTERFSMALQGIYTGYAFICGGGIHYIRAVGQPAVIYGYGDHDAARIVFDTKKHHYILLPAVQFASLVEPERLNTLEAYISIVDQSGILKELVAKADLLKLLTVKGPMTVFMPDDNKLSSLRNLDPQKLRAILLAHIVIGRVDSQIGEESKSKKLDGVQTLTDKNKVGSLGTEDLELKAIAQNSITVRKVNGVVVKLSSGGQEARLIPISRSGGGQESEKSKMGREKNVVRRYNGLLYRIDAIFNPVSETFILPDKSDLDDVLTIFDITKSTMEIRRAQYTLNVEKQHTLLVTLDHLQQLAGTLFEEIRQKSDEDGQRLLQDSNTLMTLFCSQDIPCTDNCVDLEKMVEKVKQENADFEKLLRVSNRFASLKVAAEKSLLKLTRIDQKLHVQTIIDRPLNPDDSDE